MAVTELSTYSFSSTDEIFFDTNIWSYIYGPAAILQSMFWATDSSSKAFRDILKIGAKLYTHEIVISEFANTIAHQRWELLSSSLKPDKFKDYRNSSSFKPVAFEISGYIDQILKYSNYYSDCFDLSSLSLISKNYANGDRDINDDMIASICKKKNIKLITNDADFKNYSNISILTANKRLLTI